MKNLIKLFLIIILICSGCTWIRFASKPTFSNVETIPLNISIRLENNQVTNNYGPLIVKYLDEFKVFNSIIYPYKEGENIDGILDININGRWRKNVVGYLVVLSPGLSPFLGLNIVGKHETKADLNKKLTKIVSYTFETETKIKYGVMADKKLVILKGDSLQAYKIAYQIAGKLLMDNEKVMNEFKKK